MRVVVDEVDEDFDPAMGARGRRTFTVTIHVDEPDARNFRFALNEFFWKLSDEEPRVYSGSLASALMVNAQLRLLATKDMVSFLERMTEMGVCDGCGDPIETEICPRCFREALGFENRAPSPVDDQRFAALEIEDDVTPVEPSRFGHLEFDE